MKDKKDCKIIQDLLPNYIEKLTSEETNNFINEHLKECEDCKRTYENMKKDLELHSKKSDKREVKYFKKYRNKLRILKVAILIIVIVFAVVVGRKISIISDLSNKANQISTSENYHKIVTSYDSEGFTKSDIYHLEDKFKIITTSMKDNVITKRTMYAVAHDKDVNGDTRYKTNIYKESNGKKSVKLNQDMGISVGPQNSLYTENAWQLFLYSIPATIKSTTYNGEECYYISNFQNPYSYTPEGMYVSKSNGLIISMLSYEVKESENGLKTRWPGAEYTYEFNTVTEEEFVEPDISEYNN